MIFFEKKEKKCFFLKKNLDNFFALCLFEEETTPCPHRKGIFVMKKLILMLLLACGVLPSTLIVKAEENPRVIIENDGKSTDGQKEDTPVRQTSGKETKAETDETRDGEDARTRERRLRQEERRRARKEAREDMQVDAEEDLYEARLRRALDKTAGYEQVMDEAFPLDPDQIRSFLKKTNEAQEASRIPAPNSGKIKSKRVSLDPGAGISVLYLYPNYVSTIRVLDASGAPWPIVSYMVGNQKYFQIQKPESEDEPGNLIMVSPLTTAGNTNLTLILQSPTSGKQVAPLSLQLRVSANYASKNDVITELRLDRRGPLAPAPGIMAGPRFFSDELMIAVLDGTPPRAAIPVKSSDKSVEVWAYQGHYYVRSPEKLVWPAFSKAVNSGSDMYAYELPPVSRILLTGNKSIDINPYSASTIQAQTRAKPVE